MVHPDARLQPFRVEVVDYPHHAAELHAVRDEVFLHEQGVPGDIERDGLDAGCVHVLARLLDRTPVGTARLLPDGRIGRMAVRAPWRGRGVGDALLEALVAAARDAGLDEVHLHAQADAIGFYERHGFVPEGGRYREAGIEHQSMRRPLRQAQAIADRAAAQAATAEVVAGARRVLRIYSRELDPGLLDSQDVLAALRRFGTSGGGPQVRVLLHDGAAAQRGCPALITLAQRLPSVFVFREVQDPVDRNEPGAWIVNDTGGGYHRALGHRLDGEFHAHARGRARQLQRAFDEVWERSRPLTELRALGL